MTTESVKISCTVVAKVKKLKEKTGVNIGKFFEIAALEKIKRDSKQKTDPSAQ